MNHMSKEDWHRFNDNVIRPVNIVLDSDLEKLRRDDEVKRTDLWNQIEHNQNIFEDEFVTRLPRDIMLNARSKFAFAKLLLATAAHVNNEETSIVERFNNKELALVERFERFNVFDVLSIEAIVDRIYRKGDIYDMVMELYQSQYSDLDRILDDPEIEKDLKFAFNHRYGKRLNKIKEGVQAYVGQYGPIIVVTQIEQKVWDKIKQSEQERKDISESLRRRIAAVASRLKPLDEVDQEGELFKNKLYDIERELLTGKKPETLEPLESERNRLTQSYLGFETEIADLIAATENRQRELATREAELEKARQEYEQQKQEERQRLVENELKEIGAIRTQLSSEAVSLQEEKNSLELKRQEISDKLAQINEVIEGKSIRYITKEDAELCELNFIARFDTKMQSLPLKIHSPVEGKTYEVRSWKEDAHLKFIDRNAPDMPSNVRSRYIVAERRHGFFGERIKKVVVEAISLNHLKEFEEYGFDAKRANLSEFLSLVTKFIDTAEMGKYLHVIGIASPTGWDERVEKELASTSFAHNYVSRYVSICLVDSVRGEVVYNPTDDRIAKFAEFFKPQFDREKVESVKKYALEELSMKDHIVFEDIVEETKEERRIVYKAFYDLESAGKGRARYIKDVGLVLDAGG